MMTWPHGIAVLTGLLLVVVAGCKDEAKDAGRQADPVVAKAGAAAEDAPKPAGMTTAGYVKAYRECAGYLNAKDEAKLGACYADGATAELVDSGAPPFAGPKAIVDGVFKPFWAAFSDFTLDSQLTLVHGNQLAVLTFAHGANDGSHMGMPPTNKKMGLLGVRVVELDPQGQMTSDVHVVNFATILGQVTGAKGARPVMAQGMAASDLANATATSTNSDAEQTHIAAVKTGIAAFNEHDAVAAIAFLAKEVTWRDQIAPMDVQGAKAVGAVFKGFFKGFSNVQLAEQWVWAAGDYVIGRWELSGTNDGPFPRFGLKKPTGKSIRISTFQLMRFEHGKVVDTWIVANGATLATQLGLVPPPR